MENKSFGTNVDLTYAVQLVHATCCLAAPASYLDDVRTELGGNGVIRAVRDHDTPALFDWLIEALSFQGISDSVAAGYMAQHGSVRWSDIAGTLSREPACPKLGGYWRFYDCRYQKGAHTCSERSHIGTCPLPGHRLRNGRLNQMAYSLFLFIRDVADDDLVDWIDRQLIAAPTQLAAQREALIGPLRHVYGVSDKVLAMVLSSLLMAAGKRREQWFNVGSSFVAVDTLVHNFLHRTGILRRFDGGHLYGPDCYKEGGCADIVGMIAAHIDARQFNGAFTATFPRFVQSAIWRYCAENGLDVCNGNRIDDSARCDNRHCQLFRRCDRLALREHEKIVEFQ